VPPSAPSLSRAAWWPCPPIWSIPANVRLFYALQLRPRTSRGTANDQQVLLSRIHQAVRWFPTAGSTLATARFTDRNLGASRHVIDGRQAMGIVRPDWRSGWDYPAIAAGQRMHLRCHLIWFSRETRVAKRACRIGNRFGRANHFQWGRRPYCTTRTRAR